MYEFTSHRYLQTKDHANLSLRTTQVKSIVVILLSEACRQNN